MTQIELHWRIRWGDFRRTSLGLAVRTLRAAAVLCVAILLARSIQQNGLNTDIVTYIAAATLLLLFIPYPFPLTQLWLAVRRLESRAVFTDDGLIFESGHATDQLSWNQLAGDGVISESPEAFQIRHTRGMICIPKRAFLTQNDLLSLRDVIARKRQQFAG